MVDTKEVAENIYMIDNHLYSIPKFGSVYLINEERKALIDTGPTTSNSVVLDGIRHLGVRPEDINYIIVTHIHLDHAGGAGFLIRDMPNAQVIVHHRGAKHLVNPAKLVSSAMDAQAQVEDGQVVETEVAPIAEERVQPVYDGHVIELSEQQTLKIIDAPGHAQHELCIHESRNNGLFIGDTAGVFVSENEILVMVAPPPNFDADLSITTLKKLMKLRASRIYFAHFGMSREVQRNLQSAIDWLQDWDDIITEAAGKNRRDGAMEGLMSHACARLEPIRNKSPLIYDYLIKHDMPMSIDGYLKYYQDKHGISLN
ncbi:MBL fold metallo-hydrolase [Chloroflexota bacterium]